MVARPVASATISWGLVSVPVLLYSSAESGATISFNMLHKKCGGKLKQQLWCPIDEEVVERNEVEKGYEFEKGKYVRFTPEEVKNLGEKSTETIAIEQFVPADKVDRIWLDKTYFLGPDKGGDRAYKLLGEALKETQQAAIGQYAARGKQFLVLIRPADGGLAMEQLYYADELRSMKDVPLPNVDIKKTELQLAVQLIQQSTTDEFKPEAFHDTVRERMREKIQKKVEEGTEIAAEPTDEPKTVVIDLMDALKRSLGSPSTKGAKEKEDEEERKPARRAAAKRPVAKRKKAG